MEFQVAAPDVDESAFAGESPHALAVRLALAKAKSVAARFPDAVVIGSDQVADMDGEPLGKPGNHDNAVAQLRRMRGRTVVFQTALSVVCLASGFEQSDLAPVRVKFRNLTDAEIEAAQKRLDAVSAKELEQRTRAILESLLPVADDIDRAIAYRVHKGFDHSRVGISAGVQRMVRSDLGASQVHAATNSFHLRTMYSFSSITAFQQAMPPMRAS